MSGAILAFVAVTVVAFFIVMLAGLGILTRALFNLKGVQEGFADPTTVITYPYTAVGTCTCTGSGPTQFQVSLTDQKILDLNQSELIVARMGVVLFWIFFIPVALIGLKVAI